MNLVTYEDSSRELQPYFHATLATIRAVGMVEYSRLYEKVYYAATQKPPYNHSEALYGFFKAESRSAALELPLLDASGLRDAWHGYSERGRFLQHVFRYLDRFYAKRVSLPDLAEVVARAFAWGVVQKLQPRRIRAAGLLRTIPLRDPEEQPRLGSSEEPALLPLDLIQDEVQTQEVRLQALLRRWRTTAQRAGRMALFIHNIYEEVTHRPGGVGAKRARDEFEAAAAQNDGGAPGPE